jgi:hypothetical protein
LTCEALVVSLEAISSLSIRKIWIGNWKMGFWMGRTVDKLGLPRNGKGSINGVKDQRSRALVLGPELVKGRKKRRERNLDPRKAGEPDWVMKLRKEGNTSGPGRARRNLPRQAVDLVLSQKSLSCR